MKQLETAGLALERIALTSLVALAQGDAARAETALAGIDSPRQAPGAIWQDQQVGPPVHAWCQELGLSAHVDGLSEAVVLSASVEQWQRAERWGRELIRLRPFFTGAGLDPTVLKGLGLAILDYGAPDRRAFGDLDLLVRPEAFHDARSALEEAGYRAVSMSPSLRSGTQDRELHHLILERPPFAIDLHHCVRAHPTFRLDPEVGRRDRRPFLVRSHEFLAPSRGDQLLCIVLGMHIDIGLGRCRWRSLVDCLRLVAGMDSVEVGAFFREREVDGTLKIAVNVLDLCGRLAGGSLGAPMDEELKRSGGLIVDLGRTEPSAFFRDGGRLHAKRWSLSLYEQSRVAAWWSWLRAVPRQTLANRRSGRVRPAG